MSDYDNTDRTAYIVLGFLLGIAGGAVAGMLAAPRTGQESRSQIKRKALEATDKARQQIVTQKDAAVDKLSQALDKTSEVASKAERSTRRASTKIQETEV